MHIQYYIYSKFRYVWSSRLHNRSFNNSDLLSSALTCLVRVLFSYLTSCIKSKFMKEAVKQRYKDRSERLLCFIDRRFSEYLR